MAAARKNLFLSTPYYRVTLAVAYLIFAANIARAFSRGEIPLKMPLYVGVAAAFLLLFTISIVLPRLHPTLYILYFAVQAAVLLYLLSIYPEYDFSTLLFVFLIIQAAAWYSGKSRWAAILILIVLTVGSLMYFLGAIRGLSLSILNLAVEIVIAGFIVAFQEMEAARSESQVMLAQLQETHRQLEIYSSQVEELAAIEERNRLARDLHDSVSQTLFSIRLNTQAAQLLVEQGSPQAGAQLERLHELSQAALADMRGLIAQLRPQNDG